MSKVTETTINKEVPPNKGTEYWLIRISGNKTAAKYADPKTVNLVRIKSK